MNNKLHFSPVTAGAIAISALAVTISTPAAAEIIRVTNVNTTIAANHSLSLDLDKNSNTDFTLDNNAASLFSSKSVTVTGEKTGLGTYNFVGNPVAYGSLIDGTVANMKSVSLDLGNELYVPISFDANGKTDFGWLNIGVSNGSSANAFNVVLNGYGYDDSGRAVTAGAAVPEPSSLLLLAAGMAGLAAYRRRRS